MAESKYGKYVLREGRASAPERPPKDMRNIGLSEELTEAIGKFDINFNFVGILRPHVLADPPHKHDVDEFLFFIPFRCAGSEFFLSKISCRLSYKSLFFRQFKIHRSFPYVSIKQRYLRVPTGMPPDRFFLLRSAASLSRQ